MSQAHPAKSLTNHDIDLCPIFFSVGNYENLKMKAAIISASVCLAGTTIITAAGLLLVVIAAIFFSID